MKTFINCPTKYRCEQSLPIDLLARSERFLTDLPELQSLGYAEIGGMKKISQVDAAISVAKSQLATLICPLIGKVIYCSFWNDEVWTEFHCAKIHEALDLSSDASVTNLRTNGATGVLTAFEFAQNYIAANPDKGVLVTASDKVDARFVRRKFAGGLFGDGAAATYLSATPQTDHVISTQSAPKFEIDGKFHQLDAYEENAESLNEASIIIETRLIDSLVQQLDVAGSATFLHQPGARFALLNNHPRLKTYSGEWSKRGYLPASGLLHVLADFLEPESSQKNRSIILGEASVGLQYAGMIATQDGVPQELKATA